MTSQEASRCKLASCLFPFIPNERIEGLMSEAVQTSIDSRDAAPQRAAGSVSLADLSGNEKANLSKVLFPDTHTSEVTILGKKRELRPTTVKYSRKLHTATSALMEKLDEIEKAQQEGVSDGTRENELEAFIMSLLFKAAAVLADFYKWDDVREAVEDENIARIDLEALVYTQVSLNGANDFLLRPLRVLVRMLQAGEIAAVRTESLENISITLPS
jgi:hypothetical protein